MALNFFSDKSKGMKFPFLNSNIRMQNQLLSLSAFACNNIIKKILSCTLDKNMKPPHKWTIKMTKPPLSSEGTDQLCRHRTSYDSEFAKALKVFYQNMNVVRGQFLKLKHSKPPVCLIFEVFF